jgi:hypothetical protein
MQVYRMVAAVALIFGVLAFAHLVSDESAPLDAALNETSWQSAKAEPIKKMDRKKVMAAVKKEASKDPQRSAAPTMRSQSEILAEAGRELSLAEATKRFRSARNFWAADATLTNQARQHRMKELTRALFQDDSEIPEETDEDLAEQDRLREVYSNFNQDLAIINANVETPTDDRRSRIEALVRKTLAATGS